jgi:hypothetical protein
MKSAKAKGILIGLTAILLVSGVMGVAYAMSNSDDDPQQKVDLKLRDQNESWRDNVSKTWVAINMAPGQEVDFVDDEPFVGLQSDFPSDFPGKVEISCNYAVDEEFPQNEADTDPNTNSDPDSMAQYMVITSSIYRVTYKKEVWEIDLLRGELTKTSKKKDTILPSNSNWQIQDADGDGRKTFYDLRQSPLTNLPSPLKAKETRFEMSVRFHEDAGNEFQGDTFNLTMIFTLKPGQAEGEPH